MRQPGRVLIWIALFLLAVAGVAALLHQRLIEAFLANPVFNGMIVAVLAVGIIINFRQVLVLGPDAAWLRAWQRGAESLPPPPKRGLLGSLGRMLQERGDKLQLTTMSMRALLDGIRSRLDEARDLSRYFIGLLIFLGLLGTFWGLLDTLGGIGRVISGLSVGGGDATELFEQLRAGLQEPLAGMGTAFSSSLFGLAGALVLGFVDLQAGHAQNRFYNDVEEQLTGLTRFSSGALANVDTEHSVPSYIQALLEQTAESLDRLQRLVARREEERRSAEESISTVTEQVGELAEQIRSEHRRMLSQARGQMELQPVLQRLADSLGERGEESDSMEERLRSLDHTLHRLVDEMQSERTDLAAELRDEIRLLTRTVARATGTDPGER
ncbi:flagellar motor protein MotA [Aquisalimonas sp. 2447]|uniref:flagellar motor protein MotA n=1 Tax=Aquisalimonas sp. 2447 TaxID=2740807 RepID=UPI0014325350|nr:flagellar motor protein MotA [Aquisalimonas sp. 2447]QIT56935.1 flagellar motor protein MotA [Aquisalimonas sp. 2447]